VCIVTVSTLYDSWSKNATTAVRCGRRVDGVWQDVKVKELDLYSAFIVVLTFKALRYRSHSVNCKLHRTCLYTS